MQMKINDVYEKNKAIPIVDSTPKIPNAKCEKCPELVKSRKIVTWSYGNKNSLIAFIGEAPGNKGCDRTGIPFFGDRSGELFQRMLGHIDWTKEDVYTTNIVKCCPAGNRTPKEDEVNNCADTWLEKDLKSLKPLVSINYKGPIILVTCGSTATRYFLGQGVTKAYLRKKQVKWKNLRLIIIPIWHPAYVLRTGEVEDYKKAFDEIKKFHDDYKKSCMNKGVMKFLLKNTDDVNMEIESEEKKSRYSK